MPAVLKVVGGYLGDRVLVLPRDRHFLMGSSLEANLTLYGDSVDERHAVLIPEHDGHRLVPLTDSKPTVVGDELLREPRHLEDGDQVRIGLHAFVYAKSADRAPILAQEGDRPCASCGEQLTSGGGEPSLQGLRIGEERVCPRCVDQRLNVSRDLESFTILRKIGANDEEVTYLAVDQETNERVAIRILKADKQADLTILRRFLARGIAGLVVDHPNYLETKGIRSSKGITYVVLEHLDRYWKFERYVREQAPIPVEDALTVANQLAEVLRYARTRQLLVAKRKKSGVLVEKSQLWIKVMSFDITRELEQTLAGTEAFADLFRRSGHSLAELEAVGYPEPVDDKAARLGRLADEYAEVYSIGRVVYQLVTKQPFTAEVPVQIRAALVHRRVRRLPARKNEPLDQLPLAVLELLDQVQLRRDVFDVTKESDKDHERYGKHDFGRHCLLARRLLENGITYVQVSHTNYDTHHENFNFHIEQLGEFDRTFATLVDDIAQRGMLESTLIVVMSEFGRTPRINDRYGRDHWGTAWSIALGGCGIVPGAVIGATNNNGTAVADREVDHRHLFHTYLAAMGLDPTSSFDVSGRKMPLADPSGYAIKELLA